jgi:hypothetical protein
MYNADAGRKGDQVPVRLALPESKTEGDVWLFLNW